MLTPPALTPDAIIETVRAAYGLPIHHAAFLPIGADINAAVYRVETDDATPYFLKLRRDDFDEIAVAIPAFLHASGIAHVMAPIPTTTERLWASARGFTWILYPFFAGQNGYESPLSAAQWRAFGQTLRAVHAAVPPPDLARRVPREDYSPARWRDHVTAYDRAIETETYNDPVAARLAAFWRTKRDEIRAMLTRAAHFGDLLRQRAESTDAFVLCHADLHPGNVLLGAGDTLTIVDWDNPIFAPKERDLMCLGGGVSPRWSAPREEALFYEGYGPIQLDPIALAYYRYERIIADLASFGAQIFGAQGSLEDREWALRMVQGNFLPGEVVEVAHRTYAQLP